MLTVMKFGGSSVADLEHIRNVANRCIAKQREGSQVVVVLSAMGKTTDNLIATAKQITEQPSRRELDMLLTTGEQVSVSLMAMTLISMGVSACLLYIQLQIIRMHDSRELILSVSVKSLMRTRSSS